MPMNTAVAAQHYRAWTYCFETEWKNRFKDEQRDILLTAVYSFFSFSPIFETDLVFMVSVN